MRVTLVRISAKKIQVFLSRFYWMHGKPKIAVSNSLIKKDGHTERRVVS